MKNMLKISGFIAFMLTINVKGISQVINGIDESSSPNHIFVTVAAEPEIVTTIGYLHSVGSKNNAINWQLGGSVKLAPLIISDGAWRANLLTIADWRLSNKWTNRMTTNIYMVHDNNLEGIFNGFGFEIRDKPLLSGRHWAKGFDLGWQYTPFTHIINSAEAKDAFHDRYPEGVTGIDGPKDGWYKNGASRFRIGITGETNLGKKALFQISFGSLINIQKQGILLGFSHAQVPAYLELGYRYHW